MGGISFDGGGRFQKKLKDVGALPPHYSKPWRAQCFYILYGQKLWENFEMEVSAKFF